MKLFLEIASTFAPLWHLIVETGMELGASVFCLPLNLIMFYQPFYCIFIEDCKDYRWSSGYGLFAMKKSRNLRESTTFHGHIEFRIPTQFSITFSIQMLQVATCWHCNLTPQLKLFACLWFRGVVREKPNKGGKTQ